MATRNIAAILKTRELIPIRKKIEIENAFEDSFVSGRLHQEDIALPNNVSSTIAIAISCDGRSFATTHGDHTVKIFRYYSNTAYRTFHGHPRTPWTVKYHPIDPNIVASGCLGYQVRIWHIAENACLAVNHLEFSIISLSFHPQGSYLAIASGSKLEVWNWKNRKSTYQPDEIAPTSSASSYSNSSSTASPNPLETNNNHNHNHRIVIPVIHSRNIRAVCFHPSGEFILAAAPDKPKPSNESLIYCNLYSIPFLSLFTETNSFTNPFELQYFPVILPQIHLYSDGGLDISKNGDYFVTCARLCEDNELRRHFTPNFSLSPLSTTERVDEDEVVPFPSTVPPSVLHLGGNSSIRSPAFNNSNRNNNNNNNNAASQNFQFTNVPPPFLNSSSNTVAPVSYRPAFTYDKEVEMFPAFPPRAGSDPMVVPNILQSSMQPEIRTRLFASVEANRSTTTRDSARKLSPLPNQQASAPPAAAAITLEGSEDSNTSNQFCLDDLQPTSSMDDTDSSSGPFVSINSIPLPQKNSSTASQSSSSYSITLENYRESPMIYLRSSVQNTRLPSTRKLKAGICNNTLPIAGVKFEDHICLFKLEYNQRRHTLRPVLMNARLLKGKLMKAITSTKLSPTGRYILIGYGVRSTESLVEDHAQRHAACEIMDVQDSFLNSKAVMSDPDDEVNIAQFHPLAGHGIIYGTKRGKIRTFVRSIA